MKDNGGIMPKNRHLEGWGGERMRKQRDEEVVELQKDVSSSSSSNSSSSSSSSSNALSQSGESTPRGAIQCNRITYSSHQSCFRSLFGKCAYGYYYSKRAV